MPGHTEIRKAIAGALTDALDDEAWTITPYMQIPPIPPMIEVFPKRSQYDEGALTDEVRFTIRATVASTVSPAAQEKLDGLIDAAGIDSVKAILEADDRGTSLITQDNDLLGYVQDVRVDEHSDYHSYPLEGGAHILGCELTVCVLTTRTTNL